ncbi:hypothetical protein KQH41_00605 [bacterium]|nr:hypothetical protein [bacterium]
MVLPKRSHYSISEVAKRWRKSEEELLQWGAKGEMRFAFFCKRRVVIVNIDDDKEPLGTRSFNRLIQDTYLYADKWNVGRALSGYPEKAYKAFPATPDVIDIVGHKKAELRLVFGWNRPIHDPQFPNNDPYIEVEPIPVITADMLVILHDELCRMEVLFPELIGADSPVGNTDANNTGVRKNRQTNEPRTLGDIAYDSPGLPATSGKKTSQKKGGRPKGLLAEAIERAYLHFLDKGDITILQPGNIRTFLKKLKSLAKDDVKQDGLENRKIRAYLAERIIMVTISFPEPCSLTTQDIKRGVKSYPSKEYSQGAISKELSKLRAKYPLPE